LSKVQGSLLLGAMVTEPVAMKCRSRSLYSVCFATKSQSTESCCAIL